MTDVEIEFLGLAWKCPGCGAFNRSADTYPFDRPTPCASCPARWQECPNDDCYVLGPDCPTCGGRGDGLLEVVA
jgi:hypothetical protein